VLIWQLDMPMSIASFDQW